MYCGGEQQQLGFDSSCGDEITLRAVLDLGLVTATAVIVFMGNNLQFGSTINFPPHQSLVNNMQQLCCTQEAAAGALSESDPDKCHVSVTTLDRQRHGRPTS